MRILITALILLLTVPATAASIAITNSDFEQPGYDTTDFSLIPGWDMDGSGLRGGVSTDPINHLPPGSPDYGFSLWTDTSLDAFHLTNHTIAEGDVYELQFDYFDKSNSFMTHNIVVYWDNGSGVRTVIAEQDVVGHGKAAGWERQVLTNIVITTGSPAIGKKLGILFHDAGGSQDWPYVDNFQLNTIEKIYVDVDPNQTVLDIEPDFFGACLMYWSEADADMANGVVAQHLSDMPIKFLRFPGGTDSDGYLWDLHLLYDNTRWPFIEGPGTMDTDEFITLCQGIDAEPIICVNTELAFFETSQEAIDLAADWVQYCNVTNNYNVKYWEIGNEPFWKTRFTAVEYANLLTSMAVAMKAVDPNILIVAAGTVTTWEVGVKEQIPPADWSQAQAYEYLYEQTLNSYYMDQIAALKTVTGTAWWEQVLDNAGSSIDMISIHWYFSPSSLPTMTQAINNLRNYCQQRVPGKDLPIIITEWNEYRNPGVPSTGLVRALELGESAGRLLDGGVQKVALWPLRTNGWFPEQRLLEIENNNSPTVNYEVLQLFSSNIGVQKISSSSSSSDVYNFASLTETGQASVVLINRGSNSCNVDLAVNGYQEGVVEVKLLKSTGDPSSNNTILDRESKPVIGDTIEVYMPSYSMLQVTFSCVNSGECGIDDLVGMASVWLSSDGLWDIAPSPLGDEIVDYFDFSLLSEFWNPTNP
jgi:hypothetical protein